MRCGLRWGRGVTGGMESRVHSPVLTSLQLHPPHPTPPHPCTPHLHLEPPLSCQPIPLLFKLNHPTPLHVLIYPYTPSPAP